MDDNIITYSGINFNIFNENYDDISEIDIAHALSMLSRANGHLNQFYSVAQHSINCYREAAKRNFTDKIRLACLIHDGSEAYIADIIRPVKKYLKAYMEIEHNIQTRILKKFKVYPLSEEEHILIKEIDNLTLEYEFRLLHESYSKEFKIYDDISHLDFSLREMKDVENEFLSILNSLKLSQG